MGSNQEPEVGGAVGGVEGGADAAPDDKRLWIGNLDPRINEYQLLKLMQKHGAIDKFDLLFHRTGPLAGQPRGYAFVTYTRKQDAITAKEVLHNRLVGTRKITVTWAHSVHNEEPEKRKPQIDIPALAGAKTVKKASRETQIQAIEAKLRLMEQTGPTDDFVINKTVAGETPVVASYQQRAAEPPPPAPRHKYAPRRANTKPYSRHRRR